MRDWSTHRKLMFLAGASGGLSEYTASGNPLSFNTNVAKPLSSLLIPFTPVQSGTGDPSPSNVRPISGWTGVNAYRTGKNLCGVAWESGTISSVNGQNTNDNTMYRAVDYFPVCGGQTYYVVDNSQYKRVYWYDKDKTFIEANTGSSATKEAPQNACYAKAVVVKESTPNPAETYSFNYPSTDTDYHPYSGNTYPVVFPALGKNLLNPATLEQGGINEKGTESVSSTRVRTGYIPVEEGKTYTVSATDLTAFMHVYDANKGSLGSNIGSTAKTMPEGAAFVRCFFRNSGNTNLAPSDIANAMFADYTVTTYEPFTNTCYGGTLNVVSGVLTVEWAGFSKTWGDGDSATDMGNDITRKVYPMVDYLTTGQANNMCNIAPYASNENVETHFYYSGSGSTNRKCRVFLPSDTPDATVVTVITKLSQTYTIQLTPQQITALIGDNVLWTDTNGSNTATYFKKG